MNFCSWLLGLSVLILLMIQAITFHRSTVCRQKAWLKSTELTTRALLTKEAPGVRDYHPGCQIYFSQNHGLITWQKLNAAKKNFFELELKGHL